MDQDLERARGGTGERHASLSGPSTSRWGCFPPLRGRSAPASPTKAGFAFLAQGCHEFREDSALPLEALLMHPSKAWPRSAASAVYHKAEMRDGADWS